MSAFDRAVEDRTPVVVTVIASTLREADVEALLLGSGDSKGLLEQAGDGSLFINEIEDLPQIAQRVLRGSDGQFVLDSLAAEVADRKKDPYTAVDELLARVGI